QVGRQSMFGQELAGLQTQRDDLFLELSIGLFSECCGGRELASSVGALRPPPLDGGDRHGRPAPRPPPPPAGPPRPPTPRPPPLSPCRSDPRPGRSPPSLP